MPPLINAIGFDLNKCRSDSPLVLTTENGVVANIVTNRIALSILKIVGITKP